MSEPAPPLEDLLTAIIDKGNTDNYDLLSKYYPDVVLPYAFYMANEYNYAKACHDIYGKIMTVYPLGKKVSEETCNIVMSYLKMGAELGDMSCINSMCTELATGRIVQQDSVLAFHYACILYRDSVIAERVVSAGIAAGKRLKQMRK